VAPISVFASSGGGVVASSAITVGRFARSGNRPEVGGAGSSTAGGRVDVRGALGGAGSGAGPFVIVLGGTGTAAGGTVGERGAGAFIG
jgi:hypothetical protein